MRADAEELDLLQVELPVPVVANVVLRKELHLVPDIERAVDPEAAELRVHA